MSAATSRLLIQEPSLQVLPSLVRVVGLNEAIILQQIHYWTSGVYGHERDGYRWHYNSMTKWASDFPWWSESTVRRALQQLERCGVLRTADYNEDRRDRTKWYAVDYEALEALRIASGQIEQLQYASEQFDRVTPSQDDPVHPVKLSSSSLDQDSRTKTHVQGDVARARASHQDDPKKTEKYEESSYDPTLDPLGRIPPPKLAPGVEVRPLNRTVDDAFVLQLIKDWAPDFGGEEEARQVYHNARYGRDLAQMKNPRQFLIYSMQQAAKQARR